MAQVDIGFTTFRQRENLYNAGYKLRSFPGIYIDYHAYIVVPVIEVDDLVQMCDDLKIECFE